MTDCLKWFLKSFWKLYGTLLDYKITTILLLYFPKLTIDIVGSGGGDLLNLSEYGPDFATPKILRAAYGDNTCTLSKENILSCVFKLSVHVQYSSC